MQCSNCLNKALKLYLSNDSRTVGPVYTKIGMNVIRHHRKNTTRVSVLNHPDFSGAKLFQIFQMGAKLLRADKFYYIFQKSQARRDTVSISTINELQNQSVPLYIAYKNALLLP